MQTAASVLFSRGALPRVIAIDPLARDENRGQHAFREFHASKHVERLRQHAINLGGRPKLG